MFFKLVLPQQLHDISWVAFQWGTCLRTYLWEVQKEGEEEKAFTLRNFKNTNPWRVLYRSTVSAAKWTVKVNNLVTAKTNFFKYNSSFCHGLYFLKWNFQIQTAMKNHQQISGLIMQDLPYLTQFVVHNRHQNRHCIAQSLQRAWRCEKQNSPRDLVVGRKHRCQAFAFLVSGLLPTTPCAPYPSKQQCPMAWITALRHQCPLINRILFVLFFSSRFSKPLTAWRESRPIRRRSSRTSAATSPPSTRSCPTWKRAPCRASTCPSPRPTSRGSEEVWRKQITRGTNLRSIVLPKSSNFRPEVLIPEDGSKNSQDFRLEKNN